MYKLCYLSRHFRRPAAVPLIVHCSFFFSPPCSYLQDEDAWPSGQLLVLRDCAWRIDGCSSVPEARESITIKRPFRFDAGLSLRKIGFLSRMDGNVFMVWLIKKIKQTNQSNRGLWVRHFEKNLRIVVSFIILVNFIR